MIRNILFDWSGTLVDDLPAVWSATNFVLRKAGLEEFTLERFRNEFCLPFQKFYDRYSPNVPMAQLEEWFHSHFKEAQDTIVEPPHARAFLDHCREKAIRLFVLSTMHPDHFKVQADSAGLTAYFQRCYVGVLDKRAKIDEILSENQLGLAETLFVGDMQHDVDTAKHGGIFSCAVLTGYTRADQLRASQPDLLLQHLGELQSLLDNCGWDLAAWLELARKKLTTGTRNTARLRNSGAEFAPELPESTEPDN